MPVYDFSCKKCGTVTELFVHRFDSSVTCSACGLPMKQIPAVPNIHTFPAEGIHLEHVSATGETFHSRNEMRAYAKLHNLELGALL
jgi:putative FmdB family regulatory protein